MASFQGTRVRRCGYIYDFDGESGGGLPSGIRAESRLPKGFPLFSALKMTSRDTLTLLIVDYHAAFGDDPRGPLPYAPGLAFDCDSTALRSLDVLRHDRSLNKK